MGLETPLDPASEVPENCIDAAERFRHILPVYIRYIRCSERMIVTEGNVWTPARNLGEKGVSPTCRTGTSARSPTSARPTSRAAPGLLARIIRQQALGVALVTAIVPLPSAHQIMDPHRRRREILRTDTTERAPIIVMSSMSMNEASKHHAIHSSNSASSDRSSGKRSRSAFERFSAFDAEKLSCLRGLQSHPRRRVACHGAIL